MAAVNHAIPAPRSSSRPHDRPMKLLDLNHFQEEEEDGGDEDEEEDGEEEEDIRTHDDDDDEIREEEDDDERRHADQQSRQMDDNCNENNPAEDWSMSEYIQTLCGSQVANPHPHLQALHRVRRERKRRLVNNNKFQVFSRTGRSRPTILDKNEFFQRFDEKEKEAIAAFSFLDDMLSSSCPASPVSCHSPVDSDRSSVSDSMDTCYFFPFAIDSGNMEHDDTASRRLQQHQQFFLPPYRPASWNERINHHRDYGSSDQLDRQALLSNLTTISSTDILL